MRVKRGLVSRRKHRKLLSLVKGYRGSRSRLVRTAKAASLHTGSYAFHGRKRTKRDFKTLWITRIAEATKAHGISYSKFINGLKTANIIIDRKIMSDLVLNDPKTFEAIVSQVKGAK